MANTSLTMEKFLEDSENVNFFTSLLKEPDAFKKFKEGTVTPEEAQTFFSKAAAGMKAKPTAFQRQGSQFLYLYPNQTVDLSDEAQRNEFIKFISDKFVETLSAISNYATSNNMKLDLAKKFVKSKKDSKKPEGSDEIQPVVEQVEKMEKTEEELEQEREASVTEFRSFLDTLSKNVESSFVNVSRECSPYESHVWSAVDEFKTKYPATVDKAGSQARAEAFKALVAELEKTETTFLTDLVTQLKKDLFTGLDLAGSIIDFNSWATQNPKEADKIRGLVHSNVYHTHYQNMLKVIEDTDHFIASFSKHNYANKALGTVNAVNNSLKLFADQTNQKHALGKDLFRPGLMKQASQPFIKIAGGGHSDFEGVEEDPDYLEKTFENFHAKYPKPGEALSAKLEELETQLEAFRKYEPSAEDLQRHSHINPLFTLATGDQDKAFKSYKALYTLPVDKLVTSIKKSIREKIPLTNVESVLKQSRECSELLSRMLTNVREGVAKISKYFEISMSELKDPSISKAQRLMRNIIKRNPLVSLESDSFRSDMDGLNSIHVESAAHRIERYKESIKELSPLPSTGVISGMVRAAMVKAFSIREYTNSGAYNDISPESEVMPAIQGFDSSIMRMHDWIERTLKKEGPEDKYSTALDTASKEWDAFKAGADGKPGAAVLIDRLQAALKDLKRIAKDGFSTLHASILKANNNPYTAKKESASEALLQHDSSVNPTKTVGGLLARAAASDKAADEVLRLVNEYTSKPTAQSASEIQKQTNDLNIDSELKKELQGSIDALITYSNERARLLAEHQDYADKERHTNHVLDRVLGKFGIVGRLMSVDYKDSLEVKAPEHPLHKFSRLLEVAVGKEKASGIMTTVSKYRQDRNPQLEADLKKKVNDLKKPELSANLESLLEHFDKTKKVLEEKGDPTGKDSQTVQDFTDALKKTWNPEGLDADGSVNNPNFLQFSKSTEDFFKTLEADLSKNSNVGKPLKFFKDQDPDGVAFTNNNKDVTQSIAQDAVDIYNKISAQLKIIGEATSELIEGTTKVSTHIPFYDIDIPENNPLTYYKLLKQDHDYGNIIDNNYGLHGSLKHSIDAMHKTAASVVVTLDRLAEALHLGEEVNVNELKDLTESPVHKAITDYEHAVGELGQVDSLGAYDALISHINSRTDEMEISKYIDQAIKYFKRIKPLKKLQKAPELIRASVVDSVQKELAKLAGTETKHAKKASLSSEMVRAASLLATGNLWDSSALIKKLASRSLNVFRNNTSLFAPVGDASKEEARKQAEATLKDINVWSSTMAKSLMTLSDSVEKASGMLSGVIALTKNRKGATLDYSVLTSLLKALDKAATAANNPSFIGILKKYFPHMVDKGTGTFVQSLRKAGDEIQAVIGNYHESYEDVNDETVETIGPELLIKNSSSIEEALVHVHDAINSINKSFSVISNKMLDEIKGKETNVHTDLDRAQDLLTGFKAYDPGVAKANMSKDLKADVSGKVAIKDVDWQLLTNYLSKMEEAGVELPEGLLTVSEFKKAGNVPLKYSENGEPVIESYTYKNRVTGKEVTDTKTVYDTNIHLVPLATVTEFKKTLAAIKKNSDSASEEGRSDLPTLRKDRTALVSAHKTVQAAADNVSSAVNALAKKGVLGEENRTRIQETEATAEHHDKLNGAFDKLPHALKDAENTGALSVIHKQTLKILRSGNEKSAVSAPVKPTTDIEKRNALIKQYGKEQLEAAAWIQKTFVDKSRPSSNILQDVYSEYMSLAGKKNPTDQEKIRLSQGIVPILKAWPDKAVRSLFNKSQELMTGDDDNLEAASVIRNSLKEYAEGTEASPLGALTKAAKSIGKDPKKASLHDILKHTVENTEGSDLHERIAKIRAVVRNNDPKHVLNDRSKVEEEVEGISNDIDAMHPAKLTGKDGISFPGIYQIARAVATKIDGESKGSLSKAIKEELDKYVAPANETKPTADEVMVALKDMLTHGGHLQHNLGASTILNRKDSEDANLSGVAKAGTFYMRAHPGIGASVKDSVKESLDAAEKDMEFSNKDKKREADKQALAKTTYAVQVKELETQFKDAHTKLAQLQKEIDPYLEKEGNLTPKEVSKKDVIQGKIDVIKETIQDIARKETEALDHHVASAHNVDLKHPVQAEKYLRDYMGTRLSKVHTLGKELANASKVPAKEMYSGSSDEEAEELKKEYLGELTSKIDKERRELDYAQGDPAGGVPGNPGDMALAAHKYHMEEAKKLHAKTRAHTTYRVQKALGNTENADRIAKAHGFDENTNIHEVADKMGDHLMRANIIGSHYHGIDPKYNLSSGMDEDSRSRGQRPKLFKHDPMSAVKMDEAFQELAGKREDAGGTTRSRKNAPTEGTYQGSHLKPSRQEVLGTQTGDDVASRFVREEASLFLQKWNHMVKAGGMSHKGLTPEAVQNIIGDVFEQSKKRISGEYSQEMLEGFTSPDGTRYKGKIEELKALRSEWEFSLSALQQEGDELSTAIQTLMEELAVVVKGTKDTHDNVKKLLDNHASALVDAKVKQESDNQSIKYLGADDEEDAYITRGDEDKTLSTMAKNLSGHLKARGNLSRILKNGGQKAESFLEGLSEKLEEIRGGSATGVSFTKEEKALLGPRTVDALTHAVESGDAQLMEKTASRVRSDFPNLGGAKKLAAGIEEKLDVLVNLHGKPKNEVIKTISNEEIDFSEDEYKFMGEKLAGQVKNFLETAGKTRITANFDNILNGRVKSAVKANLLKLADMTPEERKLQDKVKDTLANYNDLLTTYELDAKNLLAEFGGDVGDPNYKEEEAKLQKQYLAEKTSLRTRLQVSAGHPARGGASDVVHKAVKTLLAGLGSRMPVEEEAKLIQEIQGILGVHMSIHSPYEEGSSHRVQKLEHHLEELDKHNKTLPSNDPTARMEYQKTRQKLLKNIRSAVKDLKNDTSGEARSAYKVAIHSLVDMPKSSIKDTLLKGAEVIDRKDMDKLLAEEPLMKAVNKLTDLGSSYLEEIPAKVTGMIDNFMSDLEKYTDRLKQVGGKAYTTSDKSKFVDLMDTAKNKIVALMPALMSPHAKIAFQKASSVASSPSIRKDMLIKAVDTGSLPSDMILADIERLLKSGSLTAKEADSLKDSEGVTRLKAKEGAGRLDATSKHLRRIVEEVKNRIASFDNKKMTADKVLHSKEVDEFLKRVHDGSFENVSEESQKEIDGLSDSLNKIHDQGLIDIGNQLLADFGKHESADEASGSALAFSKTFYKESKAQIEHFLEHSHAESEDREQEVSNINDALSQVITLLDSKYPAVADHVFNKLSEALAAYNSAYVPYMAEESNLKKNDMGAVSLKQSVPIGESAISDTTIQRSQELDKKVTEAYAVLVPLLKDAEYYTKYATTGLSPEARSIVGSDKSDKSVFDQMEKVREYVSTCKNKYVTLATNLHEALHSFSKKWTKELARYYKKNPGKVPQIAEFEWPTFLHPASIPKTAAMIILAEGSDNTFTPMTMQEKAEQRTTSYPGAPTNDSNADELYEEKSPKRVDNSDLGYQQDYFGEVHKQVMSNLDRLNKKMGMRLTSDSQPKKTDLPKEYSEKSLDLLNKAMNELQNTNALANDSDSYEKNVQRLLKAWKAEQAKGEGPLADQNPDIKYKKVDGKDVERTPEEIAALFLGKSNSLIGHLQHIQGIHDDMDEHFGRGKNFDMASAAYVAAKQHRANSGENIGPKQDKLIKSVENRWHDMGEKIKRNLAALGGHMEATKKALDKAGSPEEIKSLRAKLYTLDAAHKQRKAVADKHAEITESGADYIDDLGSTHTLAKNLYLASMEVRNQMRKVVEILAKPGTGFEGGMFKVKDAMKNLSSWANIQRREQVSIRNSMEHARKMIDKIDDQITDYQIYLKNAKENNGVGLSKLEQDNFARQFVSRIYEWILYLWNRNPDAFEYYFGGSMKNYDEFFEQHKQEIGVLNNKRISRAIMFVTNLLDDMKFTKRKLEGYELTKLHHLMDIRDHLFRSKYTLGSIGIFKHGVYEFLQKLDMPPDIAKKKEQELSTITAKVSEEDVTNSAQLIQGVEDFKKELSASGKLSGVALESYEDPNFKPHGAPAPVAPTTPKIASTTEEVVKKYTHKSAGAVTVDAVTRLVNMFKEKNA